MQQSIKQYYPLKMFVERTPSATEGLLRKLIFHNTDGFADKVVKRIGRKILIDESAYYLWIDGQNEGGSHG